MQRFLETEVRIKAPARRILKALVEPVDLKNWWGVDSSYIEAKDGGLYTLSWMRTDEGFKFISTGRIRLLDRNSHLHLEEMLYLNYEKPILGPFKINYNTESKNGYTLLRVKQSGFKKGEINEWYYNAVLEGWPQALLLLKKYLEK